MSQANGGRPGTIHVCHLIKGLGRGGAEALLPQTIRFGSGRVRYSVGFFLPWKDALAPQVSAAGAAVRCFEARTNRQLFASTGAVARWLREEGADLAHAHLPLAGAVARLAGRLGKVPVVYTEHNLFERYHPWTRLANIATWPMQERVIAVSAEVAESVERHVGRVVPVQVVRNGIDVEAFRSGPAQRMHIRGMLGIPDDAVVVGTVGVFRVQKRLDLWLETAALLASSRPEIRFLLVGDGPLGDELRDRARQLGIARQITFTGLQEDVAPFLAAMDIYLMTSQFEGLPLALLEAMAAELPVLATAVGGIPEVIAHDISGLLVPFGDVPALVDRLGRLAAEPEWRRRLGRAARDRVRERFGIARMAAELEALYFEALGA